MNCEKPCVVDLSAVHNVEAIGFEAYQIQYLHVVNRCGCVKYEFRNGYRKIQLRVQFDATFRSSESRPPESVEAEIDCYRIDGKDIPFR